MGAARGGKRVAVLFEEGEERERDVTTRLNTHTLDPHILGQISTE